MPILSPDPVKYILTSLSVSMIEGNMQCHLARKMGDVIIGGIDFTIAGSDMSDVIATMGSTNVSLGDAITNAIYKYAIDKNLIIGTIE